MDEPVRTTRTNTTTTVRLVTHPFGRHGENPPSLGQLRRFVDACEGLPDDLGVSWEKGSLSEGGRYQVVLSVSMQVEVPDPGLQTTPRGG